MIDPIEKYENNEYFYSKFDVGCNIFYNSRNKSYYEIDNFCAGWSGHCFSSFFYLSFLLNIHKKDDNIKLFAVNSDHDISPPFGVSPQYFQSITNGYDIYMDGYDIYEHM